MTYAGFPDGQWRFVAGEDLLERFVTDTGAKRSFCSRCGSTLFYESPRWPGELHVALANVIDEIDRAPSSHVYVDHGAEWLEITDSLPRLGGETGMEAKDSGSG